MTHPPKLWRRALFLAALVALTGFSGIRGGTGGTGRPRGGIGGTGVTAIGVIQRFGSIFVNGTEYLLLPTTHYRRDGRPVQSSSLRRGDAVFVEARTQDGRSIAQSVRIQHAMIGIIQAVHDHGRRLQILGQQVLLGQALLRHLARHAGRLALRAGREVSVSALASGSGVWHATRIHVLPAVPATTAIPFLIRGALHQENGHALALGNRLFVWAGRRPASTLIGSYVVARGYYRYGHPVITSLRPATGLQDARGRTVRIAGYVRGIGARWRYQGMTLSASAGAGPTPSSAPRPAFFVAKRAANGQFVIQHITLNVRAMRYGLAPTLPERDRGPRVPRINRPHIMRPRPSRPTVSRPHVVKPMALVMRPSLSSRGPGY